MRTFKVASHVVIMVVATCLAIWSSQYIGGCSNSPVDTEAVELSPIEKLKSTSVYTYNCTEGLMKYSLYRTETSWVWYIPLESGEGLTVTFGDDGSVQSSMPIGDWVYSCILHQQTVCKYLYPGCDQFEQYAQCFANAVNGCTFLGMWSGGLVPLPVL